ncbi:PIN domain-containing protein [Candidatus Woesearchaeota archaeon]|nr:PIN domain-containing protein [Candidatus Woesearchaeota archaeon]
MNLVVDANIIFAALIKEGKTYDIISNKEIELFTAEFFFVELEKHKESISKKTKRSEEDFNKLLSIIRRKIVLVPLKEIKPYLDEAERISPDKDDVAYFALALKLKYAIWSNDKDLKKQKFVKIYSTEDLIKILS